MRYIIALLSLVSALFSADFLLLDEKRSYYDNFKVSYFVDTASKFGVNEISAKTFTETTPNKFTLGYLHGTVWFKIPIHNQSRHEHFILSLNESFYEKADLYFYHAGWQVQNNSVFTPIQKRPVKNSHLSFALDIPPNTSAVYYLAIQGKYAYFGNITLYDKDYFLFHQILNINSLYLFLFGVLTIITVFSAFLFFRLREKIYFYYTGYSFSNLIYTINMSGLLAYVDLGGYLYKFHASSASAIAFLLLFSLEFLETKKHLKKAHNIAKWIAAPLFFAAFMLLFWYQPWNLIITMLISSVCLLLIVIATATHIKGHSKSKYYLFVIVLYVLFVAIFTLMIMNILEYTNLTRYGLFVASTLEAIVFSLLLANRYYEMKEQTIASQKALIETKKTAQEELERKIDQRTDELQTANRQLTELIGERELLLKELYHRVKNNFHMIIGLLWLEKEKNTDNKSIFQDLINRIKSLMIIYEYLYNTESLATINLKEYLETLIKNIAAAYQNEAIHVRYTLEKIAIDFDRATSLGIVLNEILNNSFKHNISQKELTVDIRLYRYGDEVKLLLQDNSESFKENYSKGLGLKIVEQFCKKLPHSSYSFNKNAGARFELTFSIKETNEFQT